MKSIIPQEEGTCWLCQRLEHNPRFFRKGELDTHHIFYGTANRRQSEKYGLKVKLCKDHHTDGKKAVHKDPITDDYLKRYAQNLFEEKYSHEKFVEVFGKSWL